MHAVFRRVLPSIVFLSVLLWSSSALAEPVAWQRVDITLHSEQSGDVLLVFGELPESVTLPAEATLSVPAGATLQWVGQILGGDPSADPELTYTKSTVDGSDVYQFTLTESRSAQIEILTSNGAGFDGTNYTPTLTWTATQAVPEVRLVARIPLGAQIVQAASGAELESGQSGYNYYTKTFQGVKPGDKLDLAFSYKGAAPVASPASSGSAAQVAVIAFAIAAGVFVVVAVRRKMTPASHPDVVQAKVSTGDASVPSKGSPGSKGTGVTAHKQAARSTSTASAEAETSSASASGVSGAAKRNLMTAIIVGSVVVVAIMVGTQTTKPQIAGDSISQTFSQGQPCSTATIALAVPAGADPVKTAETLFAALSSADGMNTATYNSKTSTLEAGFCESKATEDSVRQALAPTGLLAASAPASASAAESGAAVMSSEGGQTLAVDTSSGLFSPTQLTAKAGVPIEIAFGQGSGCTDEVVFPELGIRQGLESGPAVVRLPALQPGTYSFACGMDMQHGALVVQ